MEERFGIKDLVESLIEHGEDENISEAEVRKRVKDWLFLTGKNESKYKFGKRWLFPNSEKYHLILATHSKFLEKVYQCKNGNAVDYYKIIDVLDDDVLHKCIFNSYSENDISWFFSSLDTMKEIKQYIDSLSSTLLINMFGGSAGPEDTITTLVRIRELFNKFIDSLLENAKSK
ncbi:hypothetical protein H1S01_18390 [Heliobacterium chlorum]|uniref:Uncharacterized protein n=1 Tax=Heliobacterium chlorum TaxID=2698 RepID=A0ABR7T8N4_HELCL|nr:hypothetical protein [Heliobacterium chlorum]MBC9786428.1 hypothetical protein [Heliobacterium chlorum]